MAREKIKKKETAVKYNGSSLSLSLERATIIKWHVFLWFTVYIILYCCDYVFSTMSSRADEPLQNADLDSPNFDVDFT